MSYDLTTAFKYEKEAGQLDDTPHLEWSNIIFVPFHPVFRFFVLISVIIKSILGPIQAVYPIVNCSDTMDMHPILSFIKHYYWYCCDTIYGADTFLHIVHRQVTDKAMRREYLPKSAFLILLDLLSLVPFFKLVAVNDCPSAKVWPNILAFNECLVVYRVLEYFSLARTHSYWKMCIGYTIIMFICLNCVTCYWLLLTYQGFCDECLTNIYDWRISIQHKLDEYNRNYTTYIYGSSYILSYIIDNAFDDIRPNTILEFHMTCFFIVCGYVAYVFIVVPKGFAEAILRLRTVCERYPDVKKIIEETRRRNKSPKQPHEHVKHFYVLMWKNRKGITSMPEVLATLPRYMRMDIIQDLLWQFFFHSPTLRKTSNSFKRWLGDYAQFEYKLPHEKFYTGPNCHTNLYYLKNGVVQIISTDDGTTPILSLTGGTILGDVNFLVPPLRKKISMRCLTYCDVIYLKRKDLLTALAQFPNDREHIIKLTKDRLEHARTLYACKQQIRGLDRAEDHGISWIIKRWWEISAFIHDWKKQSRKSSQMLKCQIPTEETTYHCPKYIGQLVLSTEEQLQMKSMFANVSFPWILTPDSLFVNVWHRIVFATVFIVMIVYPPNLTRAEIPKWFQFFQWWTDFIYAADICISLVTCLPGQEHDDINFFSVMFERFKSYTFILDVLSAIWIENLITIIGINDYYYPIQFNRLLKIHIIFFGDYLKMDITKPPLLNIITKIILIIFIVLQFSSYALYELNKHFPLTTSYFFGARSCGTDTLQSACDPGLDGVHGPFISLLFEMTFLEYIPKTLLDIYINIVNCYVSYFIYIYCEMRFIVCLYLKYRDIVSYQIFVSKLKDYYVYHKIHHDLLKRLEKYLICHWQYYKGTDVMNPNMVKAEPYNVYWKAEGEVAEKLIGESRAFIGADRSLIRELALAAQLMILPSGSSISTFGAQCRNVTWIVQGCIKCEYHDEKGELLNKIYQAGRMLATTSVFVGKASVRNYTSETDCEILYIKVKDFFNIIKRNTTEWSYIKNCIDEFGPQFEEMFHTQVLKHRDYQHKLRDRLYSTRRSTMIAPGTRIVSDMMEHEYRSTTFEGVIWGDPNSLFMQKWLIFRAIIVIVSISSASLQGSIGAYHRWPLQMITGFCNCIAFIDITFKLCLGYYNENGLLVTDRQMCFKHYLTRGFIPDVIGAVPFQQIWMFAVARTNFDYEATLFFTTMCKFAHIYIVCDFFNYISDTPVVNKPYIMILKWQVINMLVMIGTSQFLMSYCINFTYDQRFNVVTVERLNMCWVPKIFKIDELFVESLNLAQSGFVMTNIGMFYIDRDHFEVGFSLLILGVIWWFIVCYILVMLVLCTRGNTLFQYAVLQLKRFLEGERIDQKLIKRTLSYFRYTWIRTKGVNIHPLTYERIGVVFRQDLSFYFYRRTFMALNTVIGGEETLMRQLASVSTQIYFMPAQEILREMNVSDVVFIVHRGKVIITQGDDRVINLVKGSIFGQLEGTQTRPIKVTVTADEYVDLLQIPIKQFQDIITDEVRNTIAKSTQAKLDFMAVRKLYPENPYDTVQYILRGRKSIQLPRMRRPVEARSKSWYSKFLYTVWFIEPFISSIIVVLIGTLPPESLFQFYCFLGILDFIYLCNIVSEFFTIELFVENNKCVKRLVGTRRFKHYGLYIDVVSLLSPLLTIVTGDWKWQLARLLRLRLLYHFHVHFCRSFKSNAAPLLLKIMIMVLLFHIFTCGWIYVACRRDQLAVDMPAITPEINATINYDQWVLPSMRKGGCPRLSKYRSHDGYSVSTFIVAKDWQNDYIVALTYVLIIHRHIPMEVVLCLSTEECYYKVIMNFFLFLIDIWLISIAINMMYAKYRDLYFYDYNVNNLITYLKLNGISSVLADAARTYTKQLWKRQRGNWLPELVDLAPDCLRQDLFESLYMYHLDVPVMFHNIPTYCKRQMAARFKRVVLFPGKCIVREGDRFACTYFIHEGEVEKWFLNTDGENTFKSLLFTNGYFGLVPGLIPIPFQYSYYTRTVVDLLLLKLEDWKELLDSYPDIRDTLSIAAREFKRELNRQKFHGDQSKGVNVDNDPFLRRHASK